MLSRRSFSLLAPAAVVASVVLPTVAAAEEKLVFELYQDKAGEFRWRLKAGNGSTLATPGEGYKKKADARNGIDRIIKEAADPDALTFELYQDGKKENRWRLKAKNGKVIAVSSEGYTTKESAESAIKLIKERAKDAEVREQT